MVRTRESIVTRLLSYLQTRPAGASLAAANEPAMVTRSAVRTARFSNRMVRLRIGVKIRNE